MLFAKLFNNSKIASDNTVKNSLISFDVDFGGLKDIVAYFFPSIKHEIILRYRAETIAKIGILAYNKARNASIQNIPIPPKLALPLIEKMSLEHEPDMYEKWANLLIAVSVNSNPLHQQYADLLSNLDNYCANFLKTIYVEQRMKQNAEAVYEQYIENSRFSRIYDDINKQFSRRLKALGENNLSVSDHFSIYHPSFTFPIIINGSEDDFLYHWIRGSDKNEKINPEDHKSPCLSLPEKDEKMLLLLVKLGLIKFQELVHEKNKENIYIKRYGILLTEFGYSFIDCLENPISVCQTVIQ
jgi:hypothetical protein